MAASMNDIKSRMKSVTSTMQITKAMELVATSKLRKAKEKVEHSRPYFEALGQSIGTLLSVKEAYESPYLGNREPQKTCYIVIAGDRGLAGGYNANIFRMVKALTEGKDTCVLPIGKKSVEHYKHIGTENVANEDIYASSVGVGKAKEIAERVSADFLAGKYDSVVLVYTNFVSMISQIPATEQLLPIKAKDSGKGKTEPLYDESLDELLGRMVPDYMGGMIYAAVCESLASESGARRSAMNAANKNAGEMINHLMLSYNRARQAQITQEITEIVSGAEAL